jgi:pimeloyl-ACP methyl ester carboxylesterase
MTPPLTLGEGPPVVMIHGALCDFRVWGPQLEPLAAAGFRAIALPLEGYHPDPFELSRFSACRHVDAIGAVLGGLGRRAHLVGHSRGGRLALSVAEAFPQTLASLTLVEPGGQREPGFLGPEPDARPADPSPQTVALALLDDGNAEAALRSFIDAGDGEHAWDHAPELFKACARDNAQTLRGMAVDRTCPITRAAAQSVACPTLLVAGDLSPALFHRVADVLEAALPDPHRVLLRGANHFLTMKRAEAFNAALIAFLKR